MRNKTLICSHVVDMAKGDRKAALVEAIKRNGESHRAAHIALRDEFKKREALICETHDETDTKLFAELGALLNISEEDAKEKMSVDMDYLATNHIAIVRLDHQPTPSPASVFGGLADSLRSQGFEVHIGEEDDDDDDAEAEAETAPVAN